MSLTLGAPIIDSVALREDVVVAANTRINDGSSGALLRLRIGSTTLVDFPLNATTPLTVGGSDGSATFNPISTTAVASGGAAQVPDNYEVRSDANVLIMHGVVTGGDAITAGQTVTLNTSTLSMPAS
jgi:hypothetical protein